MALIIGMLRARTKPTEIQVKRSESRDEARLLPTLTYVSRTGWNDRATECSRSKRDPGAVTIPDPMKAKRFAVCYMSDLLLRASLTVE